MRARVLLVDDHPIVLDALQRLLETDPGFSVVGKCVSLVEASDGLMELRPDLAVVDLKLGTRSGMDLVRQVKASKLPVKVLLLSAEIAEAEIVEAVRLGVSGVVFKDAASTELLAAARRVVSGGRWLPEGMQERILESLIRRAAVDRGEGDLTTRETELVSLVARGMTNAEIADQLGITEGTVKIHLNRVFKKLRVRNRTEVALYAKRSGLA